jgi:hypothetical protein
VVGDPAWWSDEHVLSHRVKHSTYQGNAVDATIAERLQEGFQMQDG